MLEKAQPYASKITEGEASELVLTPKQFLSQSRQPVFEKVTLASEYSEEDLDELMKLDEELDDMLGPTETNEIKSSLSDAEFERMLQDNADYYNVSDHIEPEKQNYSSESDQNYTSESDMEVEEDAKSIHSEVESEENYPTSEHSDAEFSDQSYNDRSEQSYNSSTDSSAKEMSYADHTSESSDNESSMGYSSSGGSSYRQSYNSSS